MSQSLQIKKICPNCGKTLRAGLKFCNYCGTDLGKYEIDCPKCGKSIKMDQRFCPYCGINLVPQKPQKIEITEDFKNLRLVPICLCLIPTLVAVVLFAFAGTTQQLMAFSLAFVIFLVFYLVLEFAWFRKMTKPRTFLISDELIKIDVPYKPLFQIKWDDFVKLEISERKTAWYTTTVVTPRKKFKNLVFYTKDDKYNLYTLDIKWDFKKKTCDRILNLLEEYCSKFNKEVVYTK
ncbi:MAG: zinc ribbon domain-containing protein [Promethearchaeota archaeon]|nr:MAG: zinc ribbon domain-containing protein [Candidatus Lokiarchaeota archaeon]